MNAPPGRYLYRNPLDLPRIDHSDLLANAGDGVYLAPPGTPREFSRAAPAFHDDPDGARLFAPFHEQIVTSPPVFTAALRDATLVGFRAVLSRDGFFTNDFGHLTSESLSAYVAALGRFDELTGLKPAGPEGSFDHAPASRSEVHLQGPVVLVTSGEAGNYGSFLYRDLPKLVDLAAMPPHWRFLAYIGEPSHQQLLELAGLPTERVIRHDPRTIYHIDQAIIPGLRNPVAFADPPTRAFYARLRARATDGAGGRRLYISRHAVSAERRTGRVMLNEAALIERLTRLGFDIVEPQLLSAAQQIAAFAAADLVVGPSGAAMFNAVFCRPGSRLIDIESERHWHFPHSCLFASAGLEYGMFEGMALDPDPAVVHKPWRVNIEALLERIVAFAPVALV